MENLIQTKVGKIVANNYRTSTVLTAYGIDFCCNGGITLEEACLKRDIPVDQVIRELKLSAATRDSFGYDQMGAKELIHVILNVHHTYIEATTPALRTYLDKLCEVHGGRHPELYEIRALFFKSADALAYHMNKEELVLFPYVLAMAEAKKNEFPLAWPHFGDVQNPISMMEEEHQTEGERFHKIAELSNDYTCPSDDCQTYRVTYALLKEFEEDLHRHIHLENNLLFPLATKMFVELQKEAC